eukprot:TRINITY_DN67945_c14_g1_i4.p1 TRINITY_DN67945_c14_g1~~TRINITY_DN67945_c14_g1_i4.p1  ORF type:complete len:140 (+),score=20.93 TRINITY_DN67945_c14_g1_i4:24-422(+)
MFGGYSDFGAYPSYGAVGGYGGYAMAPTFTGYVAPAPMPVVEAAPVAVAAPAPVYQEPVQDVVTFNPGPPTPYTRPVAPQYTENTQYSRYVHPFPRQRSRLPLKNRGFGLVDSWRPDPTPERLNPLAYTLDD